MVIGFLIMISDFSQNLNHTTGNLKSRILTFIVLYVMRCAIWYHLCNLKTWKHPWRSVTFSNFTKSNTPPWVFFAFFKLHISYQIAQSISMNYETIFNATCRWLYGILWLLFLPTLTWNMSRSFAMLNTMMGNGNKGFTDISIFP